MTGSKRISDAAFRRWMRGNLARAADQFAVIPTGTPRWGWRLRSLSTAAAGPAGACWLRVGTEQTRWIEDPVVGDHWTGIPDSAAIVGVPKPVVLASTEWAVASRSRRVRADLTTLLPGQACSATEALRDQVDLPDRWWQDLRTAVDRIAGTPTGRYPLRPGGRRMRDVFGDAVADANQVTATATAHGDLHWANLLGPQLGILDWELWGPGPVGADPATLYLFALLVPDVAERVWELFRDLLEGDAGRVALLSVASRILFRGRGGDNVDLAAAVERRVSGLLLVDS